MEQLHNGKKASLQNLGRLGGGFLAVGLAVGMSLSARADQPPAHQAKKPFPGVVLPDRLRGEDAIRGVGAKLPELASWYGMSTDQFARTLRQDKQAWLDRNGRLLYIDEHPPLKSGTATTTTATVGAAPYPVEQSFLLHSRPGASRVIYLDFQGQLVTGTAWNSSYGLSAIDAPAFDLDGNPASFSATELERIQYIWQRVAEDYAPFDVDVTTEEPPADALTRSTNTDLLFGTRVVVTKDWTSATSSPCGCGGFAYVGIYDDLGDAYKPAWVFYDRLGSGNEKYVAEAIAHEAGHNLGLSHDGYNDGTTSTGYFSGYGSGATGWAPIMGVGYYKELTQWSKGEYSYATQIQDDFAVIQATGAPLRVDDHGDTIGAATPLDDTSSGGVTTLQGGGVISSRTDVDAFSFQAGAGALSLSVTPASRGPNLDIFARLYDAAGTLLASSNSSSTLDASLSYTATAAGTYYLLVDGVGLGTPATGYSDYGSLGAYTIRGTVPEAYGLGNPPVAVAGASVSSGTAPLAVTFSSSGSHDPEGGALNYDWDFGDGTSHSSAANPSHTYTAAGAYTATLRVTDPTGAVGSAQVTVTAAASILAMHVSNIDLSWVAKRGSAQGRATVTVLDSAGKAMSGATVAGKWSGLLTSSVSGTTDTSGAVTFTSSAIKKTGTLSFSVTGVTLSGYGYDAAANTETTDSISR